MRLAIELEYDGTSYHGWQVQPNALTVQEVLQNTLSTYFDQPVAVVGCGRTDTGVHAKHFVLHCDISNPVQPKAVYSLNTMLPHDIALRAIRKAPEEFHARFDAQSRTYKYFISRKKSPFNRHHHYHFQPKGLRLDAMNEAANMLLGEHDFSSFCKVGSDVKTTICTVSEANWIEIDGALEFTVTADRFLRNMVRAVVGTLLEVGTGLKEVSDIPSIMQKTNRSAAGRSVPAQGLFLWRVKYEHLEEFDVLSH